MIDFISGLVIFLCGVSVGMLIELISLLPEIRRAKEASEE